MKRMATVLAVAGTAGGAGREAAHEARRGRGDRGHGVHGRLRGERVAGMTTVRFRIAIVRERLGHWIFGVAVLASVLFGAARQTQAAPWVVNTLSDAANGSCSTTCTLRDAIALSASGDTITFSVSGTIALGSSLPEIGNFLNNIFKTLTIDGTGRQVTLDGGGAGFLSMM